MDATSVAGLALFVAWSAGCVYFGWAMRDTTAQRSMALQRLDAAKERTEYERRIRDGGYDFDEAFSRPFRPAAPGDER